MSISSSAPGGTSAADDLAAAERVVLSAADLPGWDVDAGDDANATSTQAAVTFSRCAGAATLGDQGRTASSPGFRRGSLTTVSSLAMVAADEGRARATMAELTRLELGGCLTGLLRAVLEQDLQLPVEGASTELLPSVTVGEESVTWRTTVQLSGSSPKQSAYSDITFLRSGRTVASLFDFQVGDPFPTSERARLARTLAARMRDA